MVCRGKQWGRFGKPTTWQLYFAMGTKGRNIPPVWRQRPVLERSWRSTEQPWFIFKQLSVTSVPSLPQILL